MIHGQYIYPLDLFETDEGSGSTIWSCVRTRPKWEKKLARFLHSQKMAYYLPVVSRTTCSGRKARVTLNPLFSGYIFVEGFHSKQSLKESGSVIQVIRAHSPLENSILDHQIRAVHRMAVNGAQVKLERAFEVGETVKILSGPLNGLSGKIIDIGRSRKLTVWIDMLGVGVSSVLDAETDLLKLDTSSDRL